MSNINKRLNISYIQNFIKVPSVNIIFGRRGSGKSALAHYFLETLSLKYQLSCGILGFPLDKKHLLPEHYNIFCDLNFPSNCVIFIDELSFFAHARNSMSKMNSDLDNLVSRARHKNWIFILATHHASKTDINIIRDADNIIFKEPSRLEVEYGSRQGFIKNLATKAKKMFDAYDIDRKALSYIFNETGEGLYHNILPSYWSEELSCTTVVSLDNSVSSMKDANDGLAIEQYINIKKKESIHTIGNNLVCSMCKSTSNIDLYSGVCNSCFIDWMLSVK